MATGKLWIKLASLSAGLLAVTWLSAYLATAADIGAWSRVALGVVVGPVSLLVAGVFICIMMMRTSPYHGILSSVRHLLEATRFYLKGKHEMRLLRESFKKPRQSQEGFLLDILRANAETAYGKDFRLKEIQSFEEFRKRHPLTTYEHYRAYAERAMNGEVNVMTRRNPTSFVRTTGTTGQSKYIPHVIRLDLFDALLCRANATALEQYPKLGLLQKHIMFYCSPNITKATSGANIESFLTLSRDEEYKLIRYSSPAVAYRINSIQEAIYVHALFALRDPSIGVFYSFFIHYIESIMKVLEKRWLDIVTDIEHGTIHDDIKLDGDLRRVLMRELCGGDRERALELRREFKRGFDGIMRRVWPNIAVIIGIDNTGVYPELERKYARGIPLIPFAYGSSEAIIGHALWPVDQRSGYVLVTNEVVFEFIKFENTEEEQPQTYLVDELEVGQRYEVVITQMSGLYRYRMGDIIRVISYHGNVPVIEVLYRLGTMLNVRFEKLDQGVVKASLHGAAAQWPGVKLYQYAVAENRLIEENSPAYEEEEVMPYYLIFLEVESVDGHEDVTLSDAQKSMIDDELRIRNSDYERLRRGGYISHPRVHIMKPGTFEELKQYILANTNATANQYKVPQKLRTIGMLEVMLNNIQH